MQRLQGQKLENLRQEHFALQHRYLGGVSKVGPGELHCLFFVEGKWGFWFWELSFLVYLGVNPKIGVVLPAKSSILIGFSIINHSFWGTTIFGNTHIYIYFQSPPQKSVETISFVTAGELKMEDCFRWIGLCSVSSHSFFQTKYSSGCWRISMPSWCLNLRLMNERRQGQKPGGGPNGWDELLPWMQPLADWNHFKMGDVGLAHLRWSPYSLSPFEFSGFSYVTH